MNSSQAFVMAERIRNTLSKTDFLGNRYVVTASYGVSEYRDGEGVDAFIKRADTALYHAKHSGRNRTIVAT